MEKILIQYHKTPFGELVLGTFNSKLCICDWRYRKMRTSVDARIKDELKADFMEAETEIIHETKKQLTEYFNDERKEFDIPLLLIGTEFQKRVWNELLNIPFGETMSYLKLSERLGDTKAIRAVASANGANAISILIPCHRIVGSKGELTGYAGGLDTKKKLLELESGIKIPEQMKLFS